MKKLVIAVNLNENTMRDANPHVPWTPAEIAADAASCADAGASVVHYHARTADGDADHTPERMAATSRAIRERCGVLLVPSLANGPGFSLERRLAPIAHSDSDPLARADFLAMDMGCAVMDLWDPASAAFRTTDRVFVNGTDGHLRLFAHARDHGLTPWMASFNVSWTRTVTAHLAAGEVKGRAVLQFVLGGPEFTAAHPATAEGLGAHLAFLPRGHDLEWIVSAHRADVLDVAVEVIKRGGHLAIGVGDHPHIERGRPTNAQLVERVAGIARGLGRGIATAEEARRILGGPQPSVPAAPR
jgi:uncharacterized protein (DUF849 family)